MIMKRNHGFTIVELMMVLVVLAALIAVAAPNYRDWIRKNNLVSISNDLFSDMLLARSEAIKLNNKVTICRSTDPTAAVASLACGGGTARHWDTGWVVFNDVDGDGVFDNGDSDGGILLVRRTIDTGADVSDAGVNIEISSNGNNFVTYDIDGSADVSGTASTARIVLCLDWNRDGDHLDTEDKQKGRQIDISATGRSAVDVAEYGSAIAKCTAPDNP